MGMDPHSAFPPTRAAALARLARFAPRAGPAYAAGRNDDPAPGEIGAVSRLSPYLRHRLLGEDEVVAGVLRHHAWPECRKFVDEVLWRTYWKGWLEQRPAVWARYLAACHGAREGLADAALLAAAEAGRTGIAGFDHWARELVATGYLHNHARMWFASIWIFTLRLPWALGADFFLRHLLDADPASNTLSWRWVAGLHTTGKAYLATAENIARHTGGRFAPQGLAREAVPLTEPAPAPEPRLPLPPGDPWPADGPVLLLVTPEDLHPEALVPLGPPVAAARVIHDDALLWGERARGFVAAAAADAAARIGAHFGCPVGIGPQLAAAPLIAAAEAAGVRRIVTPHAPVGPVATALAAMEADLAAAGITLTRLRRAWDERLWPLATKGFFPFREQAPAVLRALAVL